MFGDRVHRCGDLVVARRALERLGARPTVGLPLFAATTSAMVLAKFAATRTPTVPDATMGTGRQPPEAA